MTGTRPEAVIVHVDAEIEDLLPDFLANRRRDVDTMQSAIERGDLEALKGIGHSLKGVGGGFGFDEISDIGRRIEAAARAGSLDDLRRTIAALHSYLERVEVVVDRETC